MKSNRNVIRIICLAIAAVFLIALIIPLAVRADSTSDIDKLQSQLDRIVKEQRNLESSISSSGKKKQTQLQKKIQLDRQINNLEDQIDAQSELVDKYSVEISKKEAQSDELQSKIDGNWELYKKRVRANYEKGVPSFVELLFKSDSYSDFITNVEFSESIMKYDQKIIADLKSNKAEVLSVKAEIEKNKASVQQLKSQLESSQSSLITKKGEADQIINNLNSDIAEYKKAFEEGEKLEKKLQNELTKLLESLPESTYVGGELLWPTPGYTKITCPYGMRIHPVTKVYSMHTGVDIGVPSGVKILSCNGGKVLKSEYNSAYGNYVLIDHGGGISTLYAHMSKRSVKAGSTVKRGQQLGLVGTTGLSTGPHLHLEVRKNGKTVDPMSYFK